MRLHITPLDPDLLPALVGPNLIGSICNLSYHTIPTFPENNYGYLELPVMEAEKIKKKLNGAILKGKKIKVEEARPQKRRRVEEPEADVAKEAVVTKASKPKKSKKERNVIPGHELPSERKVKRGWTEPASSKSPEKSKSKTSASTSQFSDKNELLFRTVLPPNRAGSVAATKKDKIKSKKSVGEHVVHEFEKTTAQPSFLRQDAGLGIKGNLEFVEGQGWMNEAGHVVEEESDRVLRQREAIKAAATTNDRRNKPSARSSNAATQSSEEETVSEVDEKTETTSSSGSSSESDSGAETDGGASDTGRAEGTEQAAVHPLEALFKKPKKPASQDVAKPSLELATSFSFFESGAQDDNEDEYNIPGTPFTSQDISLRGLRSAAPTPDTAHPSRFNSYGSTGLPGDEESEEDDQPAPGEPSSSHKHASDTPSRQQSEFEKAFWKNRGDNNRAWKLRRRTVLKEKRQRENKARRPKNW